MNIAVLAGGLSPERDVSLSSGSLIANALIRRGHAVALADVYMDLDTSADIRDHFIREPYEPASISGSTPTLEAVEAHRRELRGGDDTDSAALVGRGVTELCRAADITFVALHGAMGENGQLQALLDCNGIKYTGSKYEGCLLAMDKDLSKRLMKFSGIDTAEWVCIPPCTAKKSDSACVAGASSIDPLFVQDVSAVLDKIGLPCAVKPAACGSSVGVSLVYTEAELDRAIRSAAECGQTVIVEKLISGREFSVGILCGEALPSIEIIPTDGFYDYKNKYQKGGATEVTPADIPEELETRLRRASMAVHNALHLGSYSRSDFIYDETSDRLVCLEANTLPGMTPTSLLPQEAAAVGIDYDSLCEMIVKAAM